MPVPPVDVVRRAPQRLDVFVGALGARYLHAEHVLELQHRDHERDARREAGGHRVRHVLHEPPETGETHRDEHHARHHAGDQQAREAVLVDDGDENQNAAVGPVTWNCVPPRSAQITPATIAVYRPCSGGTPHAIARAIDSGSATHPTTSAASASARKSAHE